MDRVWASLLEALRQWVRTIVVVVLLAGLLELLAPAGGTRRLVRLVLGLCVVATVVAPLAAIVRGGAGVAGMAGAAGVGAAPAAAGVGAAGPASAGPLADSLVALNATLSSEAGARAVAKRAEAAALRVRGVAAARATVELEAASVRRLRVALRLGGGGDGVTGAPSAALVRAEVRTAVATDLGLAEAAVVVEVAAGG